MKTPFYIGEEVCLLGTNVPFTVVSKTDIKLISYEIEVFFSIIKNLNGHVIQKMKNDC
jgi:hypothetical protein